MVENNSWGNKETPTCTSPHKCTPTHRYSYKTHMEAIKQPTGPVPRVLCRSWEAQLLLHHRTAAVPEQSEPSVDTGRAKLPVTALYPQLRPCHSLPSSSSQNIHVLPNTGITLKWQNLKARMMKALTQAATEAKLMFIYSSGLRRRHAQDKHTTQFLAVLPINRRSANNNRAS